jgi:hypothetical protein
VTPEDRRRLWAVTAFVAGLFIALCLLPGVPTGVIGRALGTFLWRMLGAGAVGLPLLGLGLALAGFDRLPGLDMKRTAALVGGLSLLVPYAVAVLTGAVPSDFDPPLLDWTLAARGAGIVPGLVAFGTVGMIGKTGGLLLGFLLLSALTILTVAWHPLRRLEKRDDAVIDDPAPRARRTPRAVAAEGEPAIATAPPPFATAAEPEGR